MVIKRLNYTMFDFFGSEYQVQLIQCATWASGNC